MTTGTNFLNEHIIEKARVHYAITDTGGISPNVVQAQAEVLYLIRAPEMADAQQIYERIEKIAQGAAMMTETTVECRFDKACSSYLPNRTLEAAMYRALQHYGTPLWTEEERAFAREIRATLTPNDLQNSLKNIAATGGEAGKAFARVIRRRCWWMKSRLCHHRQRAGGFNRRGRRQLENAGRPVLQPLLYRRHAAAHLATGGSGANLHCPQRHAAGRKSDGRDRAQSAAGRGAAEKCREEFEQQIQEKPYVSDPTGRDTVTFKIKNTTQQHSRGTPMSMSSIPSHSPSGKLYGWVERIGNKVPHPFLLFIYLIVILMVATAVLSAFDVSVRSPADGSLVAVKNLLSVEGLHWFLPNVIKNFSGAPLAPFWRWCWAPGWLNAWACCPH
jgi:hypothetical protein